MPSTERRAGGRAPSFVLGVATLRGVPTPVLDLAELVTGAREPLVARFVRLRRGPRPAARGARGRRRARPRSCRGARATAPLGRVRGRRRRDHRHAGPRALRRLARLAARPARGVGGHGRSAVVIRSEHALELARVVFARLGIQLDGERRLEELSAAAEGRVRAIGWEDYLRALDAPESPELSRSPSATPSPRRSSFGTPVSSRRSLDTRFPSECGPTARPAGSGSSRPAVPPATKRSPSPSSCASVPPSSPDGTSSSSEST